MNREQIFAALFQQLATIPGIATVSRRLRHWNDVPPDEQPALFLAQGDQIANSDHGMPTIWTMQADVYIYCHGGSDPDSVPSTDVNVLLDAVEDALKPDYTGYNTLGGLVYDARISGQVETDEGLLGQQSIAVVPIKITAVNE